MLGFVFEISIVGRRKVQIRVQVVAAGRACSNARESMAECDREFITKCTGATDASITMGGIALGSSEEVAILYDDVHVTAPP